MTGFAKNLWIGFVSAIVVAIALPICLILLQLVRSLFASLHGLLTGVIGGLVFLVIAVIIIEIGGRKFADAGLSAMSRIAQKTKVHQNVWAAVSMIIGITVGVLGGAVIYRLMWMAMPGLTAQ